MRHSPVRKTKPKSHKLTAAQRRRFNAEIDRELAAMRGMTAAEYLVWKVNALKAVNPRRVTPPARSRFN